ncbi:hypothetical protein Taro_053917 [Colocasia esculenta]|uniref:Uncharacterized protein n=1 Tax=Colocasia esculenta TaxID=4460 RepID=A0A843XPM1_COLES|nr:hypothetical protein [Colocasia esculenta]
MVLDHTQEPVRSPPDPPQEVRSSSSHGSAKPSTAPTRSSAACACRGVDAPDAEDSRARKRRLDSSGRPASLPCSPAVGYIHNVTITSSEFSWPSVTAIESPESATWTRTKT